MRVCIWIVTALTEYLRILRAIIRKFALLIFATIQTLRLIQVGFVLHHYIAQFEQSAYYADAYSCRFRARLACAWREFQSILSPKSLSYYAIQLTLGCDYSARESLTI